MAPIDGTTAQTVGRSGSEDVVEIGLLLPASWADALLEMSKRRRQSVGQILRTMIDRGLMDDEASTPDTHAPVLGQRYIRLEKTCRGRVSAGDNQGRYS